ncbi:MAG: Cof-type HAD-IIB family hydrolase [Thermosynechococcaceae cyanobacterium MS004]|nr:Cof-type HAD-IIB family hydrolase [Thermosynechococcaceae cyanobacterium MS004]
MIQSTSAPEPTTPGQTSPDAASQKIDSPAAVSSGAKLPNISPERAQAIRLVVLDIDGTIAGINNEINPVVIETVRAVQRRGIQVAIATGRMFHSALRFHQALQLNLPLMAYQGALIQDPVVGTLHRHWTLDPAKALHLLAYFEAVEFQQHLSVHAYVNDQLYVRAITPETEQYCDRTGVTATPVGDLRPLIEAQPPTKLLALSENAAHIDFLYTHLRSQYTPAELYLTKSIATFFEATNPSVNKGTAVKYVAEELLGLQPAQVMTLGDNFNDVEMLEYAGIGIAMGSAPLPVQAIADWVAPDVEQDGAAIALRHILLNQG